MFSSKISWILLLIKPFLGHDMNYKICHYFEILLYKMSTSIKDNVRI